MDISDAISLLALVIAAIKLGFDIGSRRQK